MTAATVPGGAPDDPAARPADDIRPFATLTFLRGALLALVVTMLAGAMSVLFYIPRVATGLTGLGVDFAMLRPLHTTFASAWIFLGAIAVVHRYLEEVGGPVDAPERWCVRGQVLLWAVAGAGVVLTLLTGVASGREYMGFHPILSLPILLGWLLFTVNFLRATWRGFWHRPVYVTMWGVAILFFIFTFVEQHAWLLPEIFSSPIVDLRLQWKATGTLVGSFNLFVYGSLYYVAERLSGDERYGRSKLAYALLTIGLLNSFTNFAHHTYHLPQSELVKWISFLVSMSEVLILARVLWDVAHLASRGGKGPFRAHEFFLVSAKWWTSALLLSAILISIPPLNTIIHGTFVVTAHAMGSEIGIDSIVLFAALSWMLSEVQSRRGSDVAPLHAARVRLAAHLFNVAAGTLVLWLHVAGVLVGVARYQHLPPPTWLRLGHPGLFVATGLAATAALAPLLITWIQVGFQSQPRRPTRDADSPLNHP